jgi:hypothetical protein
MAESSLKKVRRPSEKCDCLDRISGEIPSVKVEKSENVSSFDRGTRFCFSVVLSCAQATERAPTEKVNDRSRQIGQSIPAFERVDRVLWNRGALRMDICVILICSRDPMGGAT